MDTGYECEFVQSVCKDIQTECAICLLILRQPYIVQCCGNRFCKACLERIAPSLIASAEIHCPLCKQNIIAAIPDKQLERVLNEKQVYCSNKHRGCAWTGELAKLEDRHLNENPPHDKLLEGCAYVQIMCCLCQRAKVERRAMEDHMKTECPRREVLCKYCKQHRTAYEDIAQIHYPVCSYVTVSCPKGCGTKHQRRNLASHIAKWCPKNPLPCPFHIVGCTKKLTRSKMDYHLSDRAVFMSHLSDMDKEFHALRNEIGNKDTQIKMSRKEIMRKDEEARTLRKEIERLKIDMSTLTKNKNELISNLSGRLKTNERHLNSLQEEFRDREDALKEELDRLKEVHAMEAKASKHRLSALQDEVVCKDQRIKSLNYEVERLKILCSQEAKDKRDAKSSVWALSQTVKDKDFHIDKLKKKNILDNEAVELLKSSNEELKKQVTFLESKLGMMKVELKAAQQQKCNTPEQLVNPPANESGVLGAALGVAVGVGIASVAAVLKR